MSGEKVLRDHYATLGVSRNASPREIRSARNRLLRQYHPDLHSQADPHWKEKTITILLAAKVLLDDDARREYDQTYAYVHGPKRSAGESPPPAVDKREESVICDSCGRRNGWGRTYCLYCGAGIGDAPAGIRLDDALFEELRRPDRSETILNFGCGALLGLSVFGLYGFRILAAGRSDSGLLLVLVTTLGALAFGAASARFRDKFWWVALENFGAIPLLLFLLLFAVLVVLRRDPEGAKALAKLLLVLGAATLFLTRGRIWSVVTKLLGKRPP